MNAPTSLKEYIEQAKRDVLTLEREQAPQAVLDAAKEILDCVQCGLRPPADCVHVVRKYIHNRSTQNRFGK